MYGRKYMGVERTTAIVDPDWPPRPAVARRESRRPRRRGARRACGGASGICQPLTLIGCNRGLEGSPRSAGPECVRACRCEIGVRQPGRRKTQFYFTRARGDAIRTVAVRPWALWSLAVFAALTLSGPALTTFYLVFHDDMLAALASRAAEQQYAYEDRIAEARAELDRVAGRQLLDQSSFEGKLHELLSRQARLEQRSAIVAALADQTNRSLAAAEPRRAARRPPPPRPRPPPCRRSAPPVRSPPRRQLLGPRRAPSRRLRRIAAAGPPKPRPLDDARPQSAARAAGRGRARRRRRPARRRRQSRPRRRGAPQPDLAVARSHGAARSDGGRRDRHRRAGRRGQVGRRRGARRARRRRPAVAPAIQRRRRRPVIPLSVDPAAPAFDKALASAARDVAEADRLGRLLPILPVRAPLIGEAQVSSPFGYRVDPFLGRPELHPGRRSGAGRSAVEVRATAGGRVTHAGPMGGYGDMVEIDHGNGLVTRYGHLSEILVAEGQAVAPTRCSDVSARPAARPARTSTTKCGSTANRSTRNASWPPARRCSARCSERNRDRPSRTALLCRAPHPEPPSEAGDVEGRCRLSCFNAVLGCVLVEALATP